jgi:flagellar protein FliS
MFSKHNPRAASAYHRIGVETATNTSDKHQVVSLLFDGFLGAIVKARGCLSRGDVPGKVAAVSLALRILEEGLMTGLDKVDGGELASNLESVYQYASRTMILANVRNDDALFQEVQNLIEPIAQSWKAINPSLPENKSAPKAATTRLSLVGN